MTSRLTLLLIIMTAVSCWCQVTVTGKVTFRDDNSSAPGIQVVEKYGTKHGTVTENDGTFSLTVSDLDATLVFTFIGVVPQEIELKGRKEIFVRLKLDCNKDFFDSKQMHFYFSSGLVNNPFGGQIDLASPSIFGGTIKASYSYQTNLDQNEFQNGMIEFNHFISNCDLDIDFKWQYRNFSFDNFIQSTANSFETDLNVSGIKLIAGYSHLNFRKFETSDSNNSPGLTIGAGKFLGRPFFGTAVAKISLYRSNIEYQAYLQGGYKRLLYFIKLHKLNSFNEISLGIGTGFSYRKRRH